MYEICQHYTYKQWSWCGPYQTYQEALEDARARLVGCRAMLYVKVWDRPANAVLATVVINRNSGNTATMKGSGAYETR